MNDMERETNCMDKRASGAEAGGGPGSESMVADTLLRNDVYDQSDEDLRNITDIMLDMRSGKVAYAVMSFGGFLGMGEILFAVPWSALTLDPENKRFVLNADQGSLENAPGFDQDDWPDMPDPEWAKDIHAYCGMEPASDAEHH